jgi:hypothetical protein
VTDADVVDELNADPDNPESRTPYQIARDKRLAEAQALRDQGRNAKEARKAHLRNYRISKSMKRAWAKRKRTGMDPEPYETGQPRDESRSTAGIAAYRNNGVLPPQLRVDQEELRWR